MPHIGNEHHSCVTNSCAEQRRYCPPTPSICFTCPTHPLTPFPTLPSHIQVTVIEAALTLLQFVLLLVIGWAEASGVKPTCTQPQLRKPPFSSRAQCIHSPPHHTQVTVVEAALTLLQFVLLLVIGWAVDVKVWRKFGRRKSRGAAANAVVVSKHDVMCTVLSLNGQSWVFPPV